MTIELINEYKELDKKYKAHTDSRYEYLVNFSRTRLLPIHRWFYFVEGYSPHLVESIFRYLNVETTPETTVFDPFAGSGTTLLTAKQLGMRSIGFEINPFSAFMIKVKTRNYTKDEIDLFQSFVLPEYKPIPNVHEKYELRIIKNLFDQEQLEKIELLKCSINQETNSKVRDLLFLALLTILPTVSNYRKGGNGLKRKTVIKKADVYVEFVIKLAEIYQDIKGLQNTNEPTIINDSCLNISKYEVPAALDISLFSPPYANCFDPFEVYKTELWVGEFVKSYKELSIRRREALTSNLNANLKKEIEDVHRTKLLEEIISNLESRKLWDKRIPKMLDTYFSEMYLLLNEIFGRTKNGGHCVIVVGNSAYGYLSIPTDLLLGQVGEKAGFSVQEIIVARKNEASSQQHSKLGAHLEYLRESIIVLKK